MMVKHLPDSQLDFSDIPECTAEQLERARFARAIHCWENKGTVFLDEVLEWCIRQNRVDTLLVTSRPSGNKQEGFSLDPSVEGTVQSIFGSKVVESFLATAWPGTELITPNGRRRRHVGKVYVIRFDEAVMKKMVAVENELFRWLHSSQSLPEDICVFRSGARLPLLSSVTHERDAFILSRSARPPGFQKSDLEPRHWYVWNGPHFCRL
jgi:hypothetical protein